MDRFEDLVDFKESTLKNIYIPVWIDLKLVNCELDEFANIFTFQYG